MIIAVDFDGTIVEHKYPEIGKEIPFAITTLKRLQAEHHILILWTVREGKLLEDAVLRADFFIDDRNVGYLPDWGAIYEMITNKLSSRRYYRERYQEYMEEKTSFWKRVFGWKK